MDRFNVVVPGRRPRNWSGHSASVSSAMVGGSVFAAAAKLSNFARGGAAASCNPTIALACDIQCGNPVENSKTI